MRVRKITVENFRALAKVELGLSAFTCIIGENNAGKSSLLHAIIRFKDGQKLSPTDYYDPTRPVKIAAELEVDEADLGQLVDEHRTRIAEVRSDGVLRLIRTYQPNGESALMCVRKAPREERWREGSLNAKLKGKKGAELRDLVEAEYPELLDRVAASPTQKAVRDLVDGYLHGLPAEQFIEVEAPLPSGIDRSVSALMPEPVYIEAVKDVTADMKTSDRATFGRVLGLLLNVIGPKLSEEKELFEKLRAKLSVVEDESGVARDGRLAEIIEVEDRIRQNLQANFPDTRVHVRIPPPEIKSVLQGANVDIYDGAVTGPVETVGDGLKRSVLFALFRTYLDLSKRPEWSAKVGDKPERPRYIFLFEEPELYLHPKAQQVLYEALGEVSKSFQVVVTTHSPLFFSPGRTTGFARMKKARCNSTVKPCSTISVVDLNGNISTKDAFQIICYENSSVAFFADRVLLVEGDSDIIAYQHIAQCLRPDCDFERGSVRMVRVGGKQSFKRFGDFFMAFGIEVLILTDLDFVLRGFDQLELEASSPLVKARSDLLQELDKHSPPRDLTPREAKKALERGDLSRAREHVFVVARKAANGEAITQDDLDLIQPLIDEQSHKPRLECLRSDESVRGKKLNLLADLRESGVLVLSRGAIEDYYPEGVAGPDKPTRAECFSKATTCRDDVLRLAGDVPLANGETANELVAIFDRIFRDSVPDKGATVPEPAVVAPSAGVARPKKRSREKKA